MSEKNPDVLGKSPTQPTVGSTPEVASPSDVYAESFALQTEDVLAPEGLTLAPTTSETAPLVSTKEGEGSIVGVEELKKNIEHTLDNTTELPPELAAKSKEELSALKEEAGATAEVIAALSPEQQEKVKWTFDNFGYKIEQGKNAAFGKIFSSVSNILGTESVASNQSKFGTAGRFLSALGDAYKERNEDLDRKMDIINETRQEKGTTTKMQKLGHTMQVVGGALRWGRIIKEATTWVGVTPLRVAQTVATVAETGTRVGKEARLKNEEVINQTRISEENLNAVERASAWEAYQDEHKDDEGGIEDNEASRAMACHEFTVNKAADEAWAIYARAQEKHKLDPKNKGEGNVSSEDLKRAYSEGLPEDILKRLAENPVPGDAHKGMQRIFRKHLEVEVGQMQRKLDAIEADASLTPTQKEKTKERYMEQWGNGKTLKDFDRMLTQQGTVDEWAMYLRYGTGVAKVASAALMGGSIKSLFGHVADTLAGWNAPAFGPLVASAGVDDVVKEIPSTKNPVESGAEAADAARDNFTEESIAHGAYLKYPEQRDAIAEQLGMTREELDKQFGITPQAKVVEGGFAGSGVLAQTPFEEDFTGSNALSDTKEIFAENVIAPSEKLNEYAVRSGDTMTAILKSKFPGITDAQIESLRGQDLTKFGISSGNLDKIEIDDKLDLNKFEEALKNGKDAAGETIKTTIEVFPNTAIPPEVPGGEDAELNSGGLETSQIMPSRILSELSVTEIANWPQNKPLPWPTSDIEARDLFGAVETTSRKDAESMKAFLGRYPNQEEFVSYSQVGKIDASMAYEMLLQMKQSPQSLDQIKELVRPIAEKILPETTPESASEMPLMPRGGITEA